MESLSPVSRLMITHSKKRRFLTQDTIKFDCPASVQLSEVIKFPDYRFPDYKVKNT